MTTGFGIGALRAGAVLVPAVLVGALWLANSPARARAAAVLAVLWNVVGLLAVNAVAVRAGWWTFGTDGSMWAGVPVDVVIGWALLWGTVPVLMSPWVNPIVSVSALVIGDVFAMGALSPLVELHEMWWAGELLAVTVCLLPGAVLGWATARDRLLRIRSTLQVVLFGGILLFVLPTVAFVQTGTGWGRAWDQLGGPLDLVLVQFGAGFGIVALRAVADFAQHGGTPYPWDPPTRLVTGGPYAYIANPMQASAVGLLLIGAAMVGQPSLVLAAGIAVVFGSGIAGWHEAAQLRGRFGDSWAAYRSQVRPWLPRWRPYRGRPPARLYVALGCDPCSEVGSWFARHRCPTLEIRAAEEHRQPLRRLRYEDAEGTVLTGTRALGAALEHVSLGYAVLGWLIRAPGLAWFVQLLADAVGGGPRRVVGAATDRSGSA